VLLLLAMASCAGTLVLLARRLGAEAELGGGGVDSGLGGGGLENNPLTDV
jgi:hypothetical protein